MTNNQAPMTNGMSQRVSLLWDIACALLVPLVVVAIVEPFVGSSYGDWNIASRINGGSGRVILVLSPDSFCDVGQVLHYTIQEQGKPILDDDIPAFVSVSCSESVNFVPLVAEDGNLVAVVDRATRREVYILCDFGKRTFWPLSWKRKVSPEAVDMLDRIRMEYPKARFFID